jgi:hypothetical protein
MKQKPGNIQIINANNENARCRHCGRTVELGSFKYAGEVNDYPKYRLEKNVCNCGKEFLMRFNLFDKNGHIDRNVFNGDLNDPNYQWRDLWTKEQVEALDAHMAICKDCMAQHDEVVLEDAVLGAIIHSLDANKIGALNE